MGGKTAQTTSQVQIPPDVLARYNSVNANAQSVASQPFQQYSTDPNAFVSPINAQQQAGIAGVNQSAGAYAPYLNAAAGAVNNAAGTAMPYFNAANESINNAAATGAGGTMQAYNPLAAGQAQASGLNAGALQAFTGAQAGAQPYMGAATSAALTGLGAAQPFNMAAANLASGSAQAVNPSGLDSAAINKYMSPYLDTVLKGALDPMIQMQGQEQSALKGNQILGGAFGGDRANIASAQLAGQQSLARGQLASGILQNAYGQAVNTAQQQQGVGLSAEQANRAALGQAAQLTSGIGGQMYGQFSGTGEQLANLGQAGYGMSANTGQNLASLGQQEFGQGAATSAQQAALAQQMYGQGANTAQMQAALGQGVYGLGSDYSSQLAQLGMAAQTAGLTGAQAQLGAGTLQQQTDQAGKTALYNQFQQQQGYPFQVAQFLANIAMGTGSLSGSTTINTQPVQGFLSDERAKEDIEPIGKTFDGQNIIRFRYKGDPRKQIGLSAQEVEKVHPEAVGESGGLKIVDYDRATADAAESGKGLAAGGVVGPNDAMAGYANGGGIDLASLLQMQQGMYAPMSGNGPAGYGGGIVKSLGDFKLTPSQAPTIKEQSLKDTTENLSKMYDLGKGMYDKFSGPGQDPVTGENTPLANDAWIPDDSGLSPEELAEKWTGRALWLWHEWSQSGPQIDVGRAAAEQKV